MVRLSNGFYSFSDSYFKAMKKQDLINYIRTIEKNWENQLITNDIQYSNCIRLLAEERNKAIDEFAEKLKNKYPLMEDCFGVPNVNYNLRRDIDKIAEEMRGAL